MATVIERLVIQGSNPLGGPPSSSSVRCSVPAARPYRKPTTPAATPVVLPPHPAHAVTPTPGGLGGRPLPAGLLTISGQGSTRGSIKSGAASPASVAASPGVPDPKGEGADQGHSVGAMQGDALTPGGATPIVKKMEYLALVRQARQGMTSADGVDDPRVGATHVTPTPRAGVAISSRASASSTTRGSRFVVEGRKVANRSPVFISRTAVSSRQDHHKNSTNRKTRSVVQDALNYSASEASFGGSERPEGHLEQYQIFPMTAPASTMSSSSSFRGGGGGTSGSVRSFRSDRGLSCSTSNLGGKRGTRLPLLTRGSSEPGGVNLQDSSRPLWRRQAGSSSASIGSRDELTSVADDLLFARLRRSALSEGGNRRSNKVKQGVAASGSSSSRSRAAQQRHEEEQLRACLSVAGQVAGNDASSSRPNPKGNKWSSANNPNTSRAGPSPRAQDKTNLSSEGALLFKRHKLMEKITKREPGKKYNFTSVSSYLNFNKQQIPITISVTPATVASNSMPPPGYYHYPSDSTTTGTGKPTPRAPGPTPETSPRKKGWPQKRGMPYKHDATIITDLDDYFTVKTPRFDSKAKTSVDGNNNNDDTNKNTPKAGGAAGGVVDANGPLAVVGGSDGGPAGAGEASAAGTEAGIPGDNGGEAPQSVPSDRPMTEASDRKTRVQRGPIVSVPSADSEHWTESVLT